MNGLILEPPRTVVVSNWKHSGRQARINAHTYDPARDGEIVEPPTAYFEKDIAEYESAQHAAQHVERPPGHASPNRPATPGTE